ncbi:MAG: hypothetical protein AABZ06_12380 [Bdellovibrionota bacterium]
MGTKKKIGNIVHKAGDFVSEQQAFQQLKAKWDELDPQSRMYLKVLSASAGSLLLIFIMASSIYNVYRIKKDVTTKLDLLMLVQSANDELRRLKESNASATSAHADLDSTPWPAYFENVASNAGIGKEVFSVSTEKMPEKPVGETKESLFDISLKHINIKQAIRYAVNLESGAKPVKLRNLAIDTKQDPKGYLDATLSVSAFTPAQK